MKTDDLIDALARGVEPAERPRWRRNLAITLLAGLVAAALLVAIWLGVRPDIGAARMPVMMKAMFSAAVRGGGAAGGGAADEAGPAAGLAHRRGAAVRWRCARWRPSWR